MQYLIFVKKELKTKTMKELANDLGYASPATISKWVSSGKVTAGGKRRITSMVRK